MYVICMYMYICTYKKRKVSLIDKMNIQDYYSSLPWNAYSYDGHKLKLYNSISMYRLIVICLSLSLSQTHTHTHAYSRTHKHTRNIKYFALISTQTTHKGRDTVPNRACKN